MTDESGPGIDPDEEALLRALRVLEAEGRDATEALMEEADEIDGVLLRRYLEALGLLGFHAEPVEPTSKLEERILTALAGNETQRIEPGIAEMPDQRTSPDPIPPRSSPEASSRSSGVPYWVAAVLALLTVGLAGGLVWGSSQLSAQRELLAEQEAALRDLQRGLEEAREQQSALVAANRRALGEIESRLGLVTDLSTEICPLRPPSKSPIPEARGVLYIAGDHQHWYLKVEGLEPPGESRIYRLWFAAGAEQRPLDAGSFRVSEGETVELGSRTMPEETRAAFITMEPVGAEGEGPKGPVVLYGDEVMTVL
ncbi:MAG: anti-sigma factor [Thermoanaerobaculia bacterium]|nr:anti-sigma factor [Thermoanaerobaculia bacterium]